VAQQKLKDANVELVTLKARSLIDTRARAANDSPDFPQLIRIGLPQPGVAE
jgi:hypothetical protein